MVCCFGTVALGQTPPQANGVCRGQDDKATDCNGISVGAPKVFDNRSLTLMLEALNETLAAQQKNYVDQKAVLAALTNFQGLSTQELSTNLTVTGSPTPGRDISTDLKTGNVDSNGNRLPNIFERKTDVNSPSVTPQAPGLDTLPGLPSGFNPSFGSSASDLLNDQVNLTYQIFNLRMILERSLSDRLKVDDVSECDTASPPNCNKTRLQAVLGFNVAIDPPRTANDAVAVVEVSLAAPSDAFLVSLMPQEKTYNAAALSSKSNAFGGAAMVSMFQVGFSARKRGQVFYLFRDTDTLSYERMTASGRLVFGWMFRPVLGRRSVSPGLRQMFAILALPNVDCTVAGTKDTCKQPIKASVRTYWKKYDRGTLTSFRPNEVNRARKYWYALSLGQTRPQIFGGRKYENYAKYEATVVDSSANYQQDLSPVVRAIEWEPTGANSLVLSVHGNNFFTSTEVMMGGKTYTKPEDGLILKSAQGFDLKTTMDALANGPGAIIGRYGTSVPLIGNNQNPEGLLGNGIEIDGAEVRPSLSGIRKIELKLRQKLGEQTQRDLVASQKIYQESLATHAVNLTEARTAFDVTAQKANSERELGENLLPKVRLAGSIVVTETPIISVNGTALTLPYEITTDSLNKRVIIQANLPDSALSHGGGIVKVTWPFYRPDRWTASTRIYEPAQAFQITRVSEKSIVISRINGFAFVDDPARGLTAPENEKGKENTTGDPCWKLVAGDLAKTLETTACHLPKARQTAPDKNKQNIGEIKKEDPQLALVLDYSVAATLDKLPSHVILLAPNGATYRLDVPDLSDKKEEKPKPVEMKQYDTGWVAVKLEVGKIPLKVEANGAFLNWRADSTTKKVDDKAGPTINVEITRELTSKPGLIEISVLDGSGKLIVTKQVSVICTQCNERGDK